MQYTLVEITSPVEASQTGQAKLEGFPGQALLGHDGSI